MNIYLIKIIKFYKIIFYAKFIMITQKNLILCAILFGFILLLYILKILKFYNSDIIIL